LLDYNFTILLKRERLPKNSGPKLKLGTKAFRGFW